MSFVCHPFCRTARGATSAVATVVGRCRAVTAGLLVTAACWVGGCAVSPSPAPQWHRLPSLPPTSSVPVLPTSPAVWRLQRPVELPAWLDRDALMLPAGGSRVEPSRGHRWAEPLREGVTRALLQDLMALRGADKVLTGPLPPDVGTVPTLHLVLLVFETLPDQSAVRLQARWTLAGGAGHRQTGTGGVIVATSPVQGHGADAVVLAHRQALRELAEAVVRHAAEAPPSQTLNLGAD